MKTKTKARKKQKHTSPDFAYSSIEEYESIVGFKVGDAFRIGWEMARTTNAQLGLLAKS